MPPPAEPPPGDPASSSSVVVPQAERTSARIIAELLAVRARAPIPDVITTSMGPTPPSGAAHAPKDGTARLSTPDIPADVSHRHHNLAQVKPAQGEPRVKPPVGHQGTPATA